MPLVDIGLNLTNNAFKDDADAVVADATLAGVTKFVITGTDETHSALGLALAKKFQQYCTAGVHPHDAKNVSDNFICVLENLASSPEVVAIGECGLDFNRNFSPKESQQSVFSLQLELAKKLNLPLFLHERDAFETQKSMLNEHGIEKAVAHCFTGNKVQMKTWLDMGFYMGITGWLCDEKRGVELREAVRYLPLDRLMLETDSPFLIPKTLKSKNRRNVPANLPHIAAQYALLINKPLAEVIEYSYNNSLQFFGLD